MTISGRMAATSRDKPAASKTSTTTGSTPAAFNSWAFAAERVVPKTSCPALRSSGVSLRPIAPPAPASSIL
jgi:hypothetical protein